MCIWIEVLRLVKPLRKSCARAATFANLVLVLSAMCCMPDGMGVAGMIRSANLKPACYRRMLQLFSGSGVNLDVLTTTWVAIVQKIFHHYHSASGSRVFILDGSDVAKSGRKMPGVHLLHNHSDTKNQAKYYLGHSFQAISLLVRSGCKRVAVPLTAVMDDGWSVSNRSKKTKLDKGLALFSAMASHFKGPALLVADAYYCSSKAVKEVLRVQATLVTRCKSNAVAWEPVSPKKKAGRGRPKIYGQKRVLRNVFEKTHMFKPAESPIYNDSAVKLLVHSEVLLWRAAGCLVKYVWVIHPSRGNIVLLTTDLNMDPLDVLLTYSLRFKIEVGFKAAKQVVKTFSYRFWQGSMKRIGRFNRGQYLHRETEEYRVLFLQKVAAYRLYVQLGCIAQGILQHLSLQHSAAVWSSFRSWMRTLRPEQAPSEQIVAMALASTLPEFLQGASETDDLQKILLENVRLEGISETVREERQCA